MKLTKMDVVEYYAKMNKGLSFDLDVLEQVVDSFPTPVTMDTILNRHNDVITGRTIISGGNVFITPRSSVTELDISKQTYDICRHSFVFHIEDINDNELCNLGSMRFDALAELTGAYIRSGVI